MSENDVSMVLAQKQVIMYWFVIFTIFVANELNF